MIGINIGFVTNSSSVVYHFPRSLLQEPSIKAFLDAFDLHQGFVGSDLWHRGECATIAMTKEQKQEAQKQLRHSDYGEYSRTPGINTEDDSVVLIYGDEYESVASILANLLKGAAEKFGITVHSDDYN
jgi:hypothetical protein